MFSKAALLSVILPLVAGLTLDTPPKVESAAPLTVSWTSQPTDPVFSLFLTNEEFHDTFAIANNVQPTQGSIDLVIPVVPIRGGYTIIAVNIGNVNDVYSQTPQFSVAANPNASSSPSGSSTTSGTATGTGASSSSTATSPATTTRATGSSSSTGFGVTVTGSTSTKATVTGSSTGSSSGSSSAPTNLNAAGVPVKFASNAGAIAAVLVSAVAGAAVFAL